MSDPQGVTRGLVGRCVRPAATGAVAAIAVCATILVGCGGEPFGDDRNKHSDSSPVATPLRGGGDVVTDIRNTETSLNRLSSRKCSGESAPVCSELTRQRSSVATEVNQITNDGELQRLASNVGARNSVLESCLRIEQTCQRESTAADTAFDEMATRWQLTFANTGQGE